MRHLAARNVYSRYTSRNSAEDLIRYRSVESCKLLYGNLSTEDRHLVSNVNALDVAYIYNALIHTNSADKPRALSLYLKLGAYL